MTAKNNDSQEPARVLIADPVRENRVSLVEALSCSGFSCVEAADSPSAWSQFAADKPDLILAALRLPGLSALDLLGRVRDVSTIPFIVQVPTGEFAAAVMAIRSGASDVIPLPCDAQELPSRIHAAIASNPNRLPLGSRSRMFVGRSTSAVHIREQLTALAGLRIPVLFSGERGSGRDHAATCLAQLDGVPTKDLLKFSPSSNACRSRNDVSKTVYLDNIELHSRSDQAYWNDRIRESEWSAESGPRRVFASTGSDLEMLVRRDEVDAKLAATLRRFVIHLPSLRERTEDVISLAESLGREISLRIGRTRATFTDSALHLLEQQPWLGNVSQLAMVIEKLVAFSPDGLITRRVVSSILAESPASVMALRRSARHHQREELLAMLDATGGNLAEAARRMNMSRGAVIYRAQKFGLLAKRVRAGV